MAMYDNGTVYPHFSVLEKQTWISSLKALQNFNKHKQSYINFKDLLLETAHFISW